MSESFDEISRILATPMPRRKALKLVFGVLFGGTVVTAGLWPMQAGAATRHKAICLPKGSKCPDKSQQCGTKDDGPCCCPIENGKGLVCCVNANDVPSQWCCPSAGQCCPTLCETECCESAKNEVCVQCKSADGTEEYEHRCCPPNTVCVPCKNGAGEVIGTKCCPPGRVCCGDGNPCAIGAECCPKGITGCKYGEDGKHTLCHH